MLWHVTSFLLGQALALLLGWNLSEVGHEEAGALIAALLGAYAWLLINLLRGMQLLRWLRLGAQQPFRLGHGLWAQAAERIRRLMRARERLQAQSEIRLQGFLDAFQDSPYGIILLDDQDRIEWVNQTASTHFGLDPVRDKLQHLGNLVRDPAFTAYFASHDYRRELRMTGNPTPGAKLLRLSVHLHAYGEGRSLLLSRDITAVEQTEAMRRDFVANVSHEIRTPLTVLTGFVETMQTLPLDEGERQHYLELMAQQSQRMQSLVKDLLMLSQLEGSPPPTTQEWVSVQKLLAQCEQDAQNLSLVLWQREHNLHVDSGGDAQIAGASAELYSAMFNLVNNAIRYTPIRQRIDITWQRKADGSAVFAVKDTGAGIAPEHLPRLTERFYRVDRSRSRETGGTGLGLAIVKHVAQRHGAELSIESIPGKGSTFSITFPAQRVRWGSTAP